MNHPDAAGDFVRAEMGAAKNTEGIRLDRVRTEGTLGATTTRFRDYGSMARVSAVFGFLFMFMFLGLPFGALTMYYANKGIKQMKADGRPMLGVRIAMAFGVVEAAVGIATIAFVILGVMGKFK